MDGQQQGDQLKRGLKNRHIQLIALGGAIGTGLFLGIAQTIKMAGPSVLLGYAIGGFIAFLIPALPASSSLPFGTRPIATSTAS